MLKRGGAGLMGNDLVYVCRVHFRPAQQVGEKCWKPAAGRAEHRRTIHREARSRQEGFEIVVRTQPRAPCLQPARIGCLAVSSNGEGEPIVRAAGLERDRRRTVAEQNRGFWIREVERRRCNVGGNHQRPAPFAKGKSRQHTVERQQERQTGGVDVEGRHAALAETEPPLDQYRCSGDRLLHDAAGADDHVERRRIPSGVGQRGLRGSSSHRRAGLLGPLGPVPLDDAEAADQIAFSKSAFCGKLGRGHDASRQIDARSRNAEPVPRLHDENLASPSFRATVVRIDLRVARWGRALSS